MNYAFVTCVKLGLSCIEKIYEIGGHLDLLITLHDHKAVKKSGRIYLDDFANRNKIPLLKINHINDCEVKSSLKDYKIDYLFIIGWSQIADKELINIPRFGSYGIHPTLLPIGRGRAAIPWAIIKGLKETGVTLFKLDTGVDTGPVVDQHVIPINETETAKTLYEKVNIAHEDLIAKVYINMEERAVNLIGQDESKATYWEGRTPADGEINSDMTVEEAERLIRATTHPYPGAFIKTGYGKRIIWSAAISDNPENPLKLKNGTIDIIESEDVYE
jgi:methionyl-tRNA formyltransferase